MKTHDRNDLKLGTVAVIDSSSKAIDFGFKRSGLLPTDQKLCGIRQESRNVIPREKFTPSLYYQKCEMIFLRHFVQRLAHNVVSSGATLPFESPHSAHSSCYCC